MSDISIDFPFYWYPIIIWLTMPGWSATGGLVLGVVTLRLVPKLIALIAAVFGSLALPCFYAFVLKR
jgi:hypothetical protein